MKQPAITWDTVRQLALSLEGAEESTSYGTPAIKVNGKLVARLHQNGEDIVFHCEQSTREKLVKSKPKVFHFTDHYRDYPYVLVRLATVSEADLSAILESAWLEVMSSKEKPRSKTRKR